MTIHLSPRISSDGWLPDTLKKLSISGCPDLTMLLLRTFPKALERLSIISCSNLESTIETFENNEFLKVIKFVDCDKLTFVPSDLHNLTFLESILIWNCPNMEISFKFPNSLQELDIKDSPILFVEEGVPTNLKLLYVANEAKIYKPLLKGALQKITSLRRLVIARTPASLASLSSLCLQSLTSLERLEIENFPELKTIPNLGSLISLDSLWIKNFPNIEYIPDLGSLTSLLFLSIEECPKLKSIPDLGSLTSLESLWIEECPKLKPLQSLSPPLTKLHIARCPLLKR
ncbi:protein SUPPRESSOR OF npr1-1, CONSTITUTIVE 1-like [Pistacia vera]|uniref:protein SUPPRESSOR OF npr1-1, CONSTITUTIVE 1-like n=1 Tax=Pistacia vera TaxID=55513 RepID=UPI0012639DDB|nr:protein SUPPRESSOR OF npr1-1, CONSTITUTIVE 1-like [Pistacia vera]